MDPLPTVHVYDHCPFCVRVRLARGIKNVKFRLGEQEGGGGGEVTIHKEDQGNGGFYLTIERGSCSIAMYHIVHL
jgi:hypothetical protein